MLAANVQYSILCAEPYCCTEVLYLQLNREDIKYSLIISSEATTLNTIDFALLRPRAVKPGCGVGAESKKDQPTHLPAPSMVFLAGLASTCCSLVLDLPIQLSLVRSYYRAPCACAISNRDDGGLGTLAGPGSRLDPRSAGKRR